MDRPSVNDGEAGRAQLRTWVRDLASECRMLRGRLPDDDVWSGAANAVYRLRLLGLHARIDAALVALDAAEALL